MKCPNCGHVTEVRETRPVEDGIVNRRRRECMNCGNKFSSFEIADTLVETIKKHITSHASAARKRHALYERNRKIITMLHAGNKHAFVAAEFGLSENMISTIARKAGIPAYRNARTTKTT